MTLQPPAHLKRSLTSLTIRSSIVALGLAHASAHAADIPVTSIFDDNGNGCTLREAIASANTITNQNNGCAVGSVSGVDRLVLSNTVFSADSTIALANGQLELDAKNIEITATSVSGGVSIVASEASRVMRINGGNVTLDNITITGGVSDTSVGGGLLIESAATVNLNNSQVSDNQAFEQVNLTGGGGGGIYVTGGSNLTLTNSSVTNNKANPTGGGILLSENNFLTLNHSEISDNTVIAATASAIGAGVYADQNNIITISNSSISTNNGGAIRINAGSNLNLIDSLINNNQGGDVGGSAISALGIGEVNITRSSIQNNAGSREGIIDLSLNKQFTILDSTISNNTAPGFSNPLNATLTLNGVSGTIINSTISNNITEIDSAVPIVSNIVMGSIASILDSQVTINHVTAFENGFVNIRAPQETIDNGYFGLLLFDGASVSIQNSIIADTTDGAYDARCGALELFPNTITIDIDASTIIGGGNCGALRSGDPGLLPLADNGGPTLTNALASDSIAINSGDPETCLNLDQRGEQRDAQCDVGAFERQATDQDPDSTTTFVIPLPNGKSVIFDL